MNDTTKFTGTSRALNATKPLVAWLAPSDQSRPGFATHLSPGYKKLASQLAIVGIRPVCLSRVGAPGGGAVSTAQGVVQYVAVM